MFNFWLFFKEHQWAIVAVIAVIGFICFTYNSITGKKHQKDAEQETFRVVGEQLTRARAGAQGRYSKAVDSDIYQKVREKTEEDHVS